MLFIGLLDALFAGITLYIFHQTLFSKENSRLPFYLLILIYSCSYIVYYLLTSRLAGNSSVSASYIRLILSLSLTYSLSFTFYSNIKTRALVTISYMMLAFIFEDFSYFIVTNLLSYDLTQNNISIVIFSSISLISSLLKFIFTMLLHLTWKRQAMVHSFTYTIILLIVPTSSLCMVMSKPFFDMNITMPITYFILVSFLLLFNIVNYILLQNVLQSEELQTQLEIQSEQLEYQKNKYQQLAEAYKNIRSFMHDTKKHLFYIENCVNEKKYDEIIPYSREIMQDLESRYCTINTGNLVIDAFVSNLLLQTKRLGITLHTNLNIDNRIIPVNDYHLTIILGNLLDNALNACKDQTNAYIKVTIQTVSDTFTIHITNTYVIADPDQTPKDFDNMDFIHGYGLKNVKKSVSAYNGICMVQCENDIYSVTAIIPLYPVNKN